MLNHSTAVETSAQAVRSPELAQKICDLISNGHALNRVISGDFGFTCSWNFVCRWITDEPDSFGKAYAQARSRLADFYVDQIVELAESATPENCQALRLEIDTKKWIAAKVLPKVYGDRPADITVNNTTNILVVNEEKRARILAQLDRLESGASTVPNKGQPKATLTMPKAFEESGDV